MDSQLVISLNNVRNLDLPSQLFIKKVIEKSPKVLNWKPWEDSIIFGSYMHNNGYSGIEILKMIKTGADDEKGTIDGVIDLDIEGFDSLSNTIAYTYLKTSRTYFNTKYIREFSKDGIDGEGEMLAAILHEYMHRAFSFTHPWYVDKSKSVPYQIQYKTKKAYVDYYKNLPGAEAFAEEENLIDSRIVFKIAS